MATLGVDNVKGRAGAARDSVKRRTGPAHGGVKAGTSAALENAGAAHDSVKGRTKAARDSAKSRAKAARDSAKSRAKAAHDDVEPRTEAAHDCVEPQTKAAHDSVEPQTKAANDSVEPRTKATGAVVVKSFAALGLNQWITDQCSALGIKVPTPVQSACIPQILAGRNCIGCAKTGSGKTGAFALPILQKLSEDPFGIFALVLTPTRELAFQIADQFQVLGKPIGVRVTVITGGMDMVKQGLDLTNLPHIVVSTPGRLADHMQSCPTFKLTKIKFLVLDEADRLLEDNFGAQLQEIFAVINKKRQTLLFSATMTDELQFLLEDGSMSGQEKPFFYQPHAQVATVELLDQRYVLMPSNVKDAYLVHILSSYAEEHKKSLIMIFTNTCKYAQILKMVLDDVGIKSVVLHSQIKQRERLAALAKFKSHNVRILIATDVASRGLDIPMVDLVINHNVPTRAKDYIHRVGRTARAGRGGMALTLVTQFDVNLVLTIEENINAKLVEYEVNEMEITKILTQVLVARREAEIRLDEQDFGVQKEVNKRKKLLIEGKDPDEEKAKKKEKDRRHKRVKVERDR